MYKIEPKNSKFVVTKDGQPVLLPKSDGQSIVTEFDTLDDAKKYVSILESLLKKRKIKVAQ